MPAEEIIRFAKLGNGGNYYEWAVRMEAILIRQNLWSMVEVSVDETGKDASTIAAELEKELKKRGTQKMAEARAEMILRVEDGQLSHMRSRDPRVIWQTLQRVHRAAGFATSLALRRKFLTGKKGAAQSMQAWIGDVQALAFRLEEADIKITDQDRILALTLGLPDTYDAVIINFDSTSTNLLTLDHVITRLLNEEARQLSKTEPTSATESEDVAMAATRNRRAHATANSSVDMQNVTCFFCDGKGHYKSDCPEKKVWEKTRKEKIGTAASAFGLDSDSDNDAF